MPAALTRAVQAMVSKPFVAGIRQFHIHARAFEEAQDAEASWL